jgi:hypothetical protein
MALIEIKYKSHIMVGMTLLSSFRGPPTQEQFAEIERVAAENRQLRAAVETILADKQRLASQLAEAQGIIAQLVNENERLSLDLHLV